MKNNLYRLIGILLLSHIRLVGAADTTNILWIDSAKLREWNITFSDVPKAIQSVTTFVLGFAATIAMITIIVWWLKYSLWTMEWSAPNKSKAQETIKFWIMGFVVSVSAWFIIKLVIENF